MAITFTDNNFASEVLNSEKPVLVDFWAPWCPPCRVLGPTIEELADDLEGSAKVGKLNVDEFKSTAADYGISSIPAVLVFKNGEVVDTIVGVNEKQTYEQAIEKAAAA